MDYITHLAKIQGSHYILSQTSGTIYVIFPIFFSNADLPSFFFVCLHQILHIGLFSSPFGSLTCPSFFSPSFPDPICLFIE